MKNVRKYLEIYIMALLIIVTAMSSIASSFGKYQSCDLYLGYTAESDEHKLVLWSFNNGSIRKYCNYSDYSDQFHTSTCKLEDNDGKISNLSICFESADGNISIAVLTIACNNSSVDYYPYDILEKFTVKNAKEYKIDENGLLQIVVGDQDCQLVANEEMCNEINQIRR